MKLSLIVPMYNEISIIEHTVHVYADYLGKTFSDWELIFVDDGSVDGSAAAVEAVHAPNTRVISYQPNRGKGNAVKTGMLAAAGDVAMFLDADIAYGTEVIERAAKLMEEHPEASLVIGSRRRLQAL